MRKAIAVLLVLFVLACAGTKARNRIEDGCGYLAKFEALIELGTEQIPNADAEFWAGFTFRQLGNACAELQRHDETTNTVEVSYGALGNPPDT